MSYTEILKAVDRIKPYIHRTPVFTCSYIDQLVGRQVFFKCENFQKTGSFKARGALNAVLKIKENNNESPGVATHSSGNLAQAVAWAAKIAGLKCNVIVPNNTPQVKCDAITGYGAQLHFCEPNPVSRLETCQRVAKEHGGQQLVSSYESADVVSGQGTLAVELLDEVPDLDAIFMSVSGGGMGAGIGIATKGIRPDCKVYAVEPLGKNLGPCMETGKRLWPEPPQYVDTIAEGIRVQQLGHLTFPMFLENVQKDVFTVDNAEIVEAMKLIWQRMKLVIETSAGATVAAVLSEHMKQLPDDIQKVGVILCGGNVDLDRLPWEQHK